MISQTDFLVFVVAPLTTLCLLTAREMFKLGRLHNQLCDIVEDVRDDVEGLKSK